MKLTGKNGVLRIYDGSARSHNSFHGYAIDVVKFDGVTTYTNITSDVSADDAAYASAFIADNNDAVFIGSTAFFAMVTYAKGDGINYAVGSGALKAYYFDGTDFSNELSGVSDGTSDGSDCFSQGGNITFKIPSDWATGANIVSSDLDSNKYYIKLMATTSSSTDPDADILRPAEGQFLEVVFSSMDFTVPMGRAKTDELLIVDRNNMDADAHYIEGPEDKIFEPVPMSFSCFMEDVYKSKVISALKCGTPGNTNWTSAGVTTKGTTKNDSTNTNPTFADSSKKAVNVQMLFEGSSTSQGWAFYEVFFPEEEQSISESEDGVILSCAGGVYGVIERIHGFGSRYV